MNNVHPTIKQILFTATGIKDKAMETMDELRPTLQQIDDVELRQALHLIKVHITESGQQSADLHQAVNHIVNVARRHGLLLK